MTKVLRGLGWTMLGLVLAAAAAAAWRVRAPLPARSGTIQAAGAPGPISIIWDVDGVPHIFGADEPSAAFGLGYVHAQERLWQMEFQRRLAAGELAEILGTRALASDRLMRTIGLRHAAAAALPHLSPEGRAILEAYAAGVNAIIASRSRHTLPVEFAMVGVAPRPWTPVDSVAWAKMMAWGLSTNWTEELLRTALAARVGDEGADALVPAATRVMPLVLPDFQLVVPPLPPETPAAPGPVPMPGAAVTAAHLLALAADVAPFAPIPASSGASNNWVLGGARTASGKPLLANDPHLGTQAPAVWYLAHLKGGRLNAIGATLPGAPGVVIGHNGRIAWGMTNTQTDVQDLFVERVTHRDTAEFRGQLEPMRIRMETIRVEDAPDVVLRVRATRHGPLISDVVDNAPGAVALRWTALDEVDRTIDALQGVARAGNWDEFVAALGAFKVAMQNIVYADVDGNIGYYAPGAVPVRAAGDGRRPVPGWTGEFEWTGYVPYEELPRAFNPPRGFVASANNQVTPDSYPHHLSSSWDPGHRAARIIELIEARGRHTLDDMAEMQGDVRSHQARTVLPLLSMTQPRGDRSRAALERLRVWDGTSTRSSPEAAIYRAWWQRLGERLFEDELGPEAWRTYERFAFARAKAIENILAGGDQSWCDDVRTSEVESCGAIAGIALSEALASAAAQHGGVDPREWELGTVNRVAFPHLPFDAVTWLRPVFSRTLPSGGDPFTVNPVMVVRDRTFVPSYRQIVDLSALDDSRFVIPLGQSGQVFSGRYDDLLQPWYDVRHIPMRFSDRAIAAATASQVQIVPR